MFIAKLAVVSDKNRYYMCIAKLVVLMGRVSDKKQILHFHGQNGILIGTVSDKNRYYTFIAKMAVLMGALFLRRFGPSAHVIASYPELDRQIGSRKRRKKEKPAAGRIASCVEDVGSASASR